MVVCVRVHLKHGHFSESNVLNKINSAHCRCNHRGAILEATSAVKSVKSAIFLKADLKRFSISLKKDCTLFSTNIFYSLQDFTVISV